MIILFCRSGDEPPNSRDVHDVGADVDRQREGNRLHDWSNSGINRVPLSEHEVRFNSPPSAVQNRIELDAEREKVNCRSIRGINTKRLSHVIRLVDLVTLAFFEYYSYKVPVFLDFV